MSKLTNSNLVSAMIIATLLVLSGGFSLAGAVTPAASTAPTFSTPKAIFSDGSLPTAPVVAVVGTNIYVAFEDKPSGNGHTQTEFMKSTDGGATWTTPFVFTGNGLSGTANGQLDAVQIATAGQFVYLTWSQGGQTAYAASSDSGTSWTYGIISVAGTSLPTGPMSAEAVTASGSYAYFTWADATSNIVYSGIHYASGAFTSPTTPISLSLSFTSAHGEVESASIGNYVYVVWDSIFFTVSSNNGQAWSSPIQLHPTYPPGCTFPTCVAREPMISASGSNVYVTFPGTINGNYQTYIDVSNNNGATFNGATSLSSTLSNTREVQVTSSGSNVYVTSRGTGGGGKGTQQFAYVSHDSGATFSAPTLLGGSKGLPGAENGFGGFAIDQATSNVYIQWPHAGTPSVQQIWLTASQDLGVTWSSAVQVSQSTGGIVAMGDPGGSQGPLIAAGNGHIYAVWQDTSGSGGIDFASASE